MVQKRTAILWVLFILFIICKSTDAQVNQSDDLIKKGNYTEAASLLESARQQGNTDPAASLNLLYCYVRNHEYSKAENLYSEILNTRNIAPVHHLYYAELLRATGKYDNAREQYKKYLELFPGDMKAMLYLRSCDSVESWGRNLRELSVINEQEYNTRYEELCPVPDGKELYFISDNIERYQHTGGHPVFRNPQITWLFYKNREGFHSVRPFGDSISYRSFSKNGNHSVMMIQMIEKSRDGYVFGRSVIKINRGNDRWEDIFPAETPDNTNIIQPCINEKGDRIYFAADIPGGFGGFDLYYSGYYNGIWSKPVNLGKTINTAFDELFPRITDQGHTLYFSSEGHPGYGNLDIFSSDLNGTEWSVPLNLKDPINSNANDFGLVVDNTAGSGYFVSDRFTGSQGGNDIYSYSFRAPEPVPEPLAVKEEPPIPVVSAPVHPADTSFIFYRTSSSAIDPVFEYTLDSLLQVMKENPHLALHIISRADFRGRERMNKNLSLERATETAQWFTSRGMGKKRIHLKASGESEKIPVFAESGYHVQIGFGKRKDAIKYFNKKLKHQYPVSTFPYGKSKFYYIGNGTVEEMEELKNHIREKYHIDGFISRTYKGYYIPDLKFSPNRRTELFFSGK